MSHQRQRPKPRQYQIDAIEGVMREIAAGRNRVILVAPTGSGKTVMAGMLVERAMESGETVLFLAHRRELITQCSRKLYDVGIDHGIIQAGMPTRPQERVQVASIQTLHARAIRSSAMEVPDAAWIIIDESHHVRASTYQSIIKAMPNARLIGLTATPCRGDGRGLGSTFDVMVQCPQIAEMIKDGYLVPTKVYAPSTPDLKGIKVERGDYVERQLAERVDTPQLVGDVVMHWLQLAERRKTIVFATTVAHSVHLRDEFCKAGIVAEHIDGETPKDQRDAAIKRLESGAIDVLCNCAVFTEGFDEPSISCIVLARPTKSVGLYRQMVGRVLRPYEGKTDAIVLDHSGATFEHGFVEEPIDWDLRDDTRAASRVAKARADGKVPSLKECPECKAIRWAGRPCPACGWRPQPRGAAVDVIDGELVEINRTTKQADPKKTTVTDPKNFLAELMYIVNARGYNPGWARHKYKEKYGKWPGTWDLDPIEPSPATMAWVRSRQIAWAKSKHRFNPVRNTDPMAAAK